MVVSFNWHSYSIAFSFLKKDAEVARAQNRSESGWKRAVTRREQNLSEDDLFIAADRAKTAIINGIRAQAIRKPGRRELLIYLRQLLKPHIELRVPRAYAFRIAINNAIEWNAEEYCSICLTKQDLSLLWQDVG